MSTEPAILEHADIEFLTESILKWTHDFVDLVKQNDTDDEWRDNFEKHLIEVFKYDEIIESYIDKTVLPAPDTCLHVEILYVLRMFAGLQRQALQLANEQLKLFGGTINSYSALELNLHMNIAIRWILSIERKMELRRQGMPTDFRDILSQISEEN